MVLQKRLDYSFQFPPTPRAARSARKRRFFKKTHEDSRVRAFDLLAILAGNLLLGNEPTSRSDNPSANQDQCQNTVKREILDGENPLNVEAHNQESPSRSFFLSDFVTRVQEQNLSPKESVNHHNDLNSVLASAVTSELQETSNHTKLVIDASKDETEGIACKVEAGSSSHGESSEFRLGDETKGERKHEDREYRMVQNGAVADLFTLKDPVLGNKKHPAPVSLDTCPRVPLYGNCLPRSSYSANRGDVDIFSRDDDENSSGCTYPRSAKKYLRSALRMRDRRIRKISASRYRKLAPRLKDVTHSTIDLLKPVYHHRKNVYKIQRSEKIYPFKKRKYFQCSSPSNSDGGINSDFVARSRQKGGHGDVSSCQKHEGTRASSSITAENTSCQPRDSHVKLRIKSFRVPELFIEVPQSATVGLLKRTVMEAVAAVLGGGLRVGMLLHGKKVRDDNKTLLQAGISHNNQLDAVGFSLEPNHSRNFPSLYGGGSPVLLSRDSCQPLSRYPPSVGVVQRETCVPPPEPQINNIGTVESEHDSAPSPVDMSMEDKSSNNTKVLVAIPAINVEALAVVPAHRRNTGSKVVQRRIRRPFSVAEVEALVQAVEKIGTGRWRDVKMQAFDNAKHRTYVDLKDKWKTLVHTAKISPQQRRGEPVPQELLDRVLTAHAHWSHPHAKQQQQQLKPPNPPLPETCLLLQGPSNNSNWAVLD